MIRSRTNAQYRNIGLLILRVGIGFTFIVHGYPKLAGGPEMWEKVGSATQYIGIDFAPMFFGFMAALSEFFGGIFLLFGLFFTPALILLTLTMLVAMSSHIGGGDSFSTISHPLELAIVFLSLLFIGPGKYNLDKKLNNKRRY